MRERAKEHFPSVLLTLLGIVQALALELLWAHFHETTYPFELSWLSVISWVQMAATLLGIVLIWIVYASNVMRFRQVPVIDDFVYPFIIGIIEFMLVESLWPGEVGEWLILIAVIFGLMVWVSHTTMRRARQDGENDAFFIDLQPAELRDFYFPMAVVGALAFWGVYLMISGDMQIVASLAMLATMALLGWQFIASAHFWTRSMTEE